MAGAICPALRVQLFLETAETKLVSINRYWLIFGKLESFFYERTTAADSVQRLFKEAVDLRQNTSD